MVDKDFATCPHWSSSENALHFFFKSSLLLEIDQGNYVYSDIKHKGSVKIVTYGFFSYGVVILVI